MVDDENRFHSRRRRSDARAWDNLSDDIKMIYSHLAEVRLFAEQVRYWTYEARSRSSSIRRRPSILTHRL